MREPLEPATETFWERVAVALAAQGESIRSWALETGTPPSTLFNNRLRRQLPRSIHIDALCLLTGCTRDFLFNPQPIDLSK